MQYADKTYLLCKTLNVDIEFCVFAYYFNFQKREFLFERKSKVERTDYIIP